MPSPPKPWERAANSASTAHSNMSDETRNTQISIEKEPTPPQLPPRSSALDIATNGNNINHAAGTTYPSYGTGYGMMSSAYDPNGYATSYPYTSHNFASPYSRFGGVGGVGGIGSGTGTGVGYSGMYNHGYSGNLFGAGVGSRYNQHNLLNNTSGNSYESGSLTNSFGQSTQATFQVIENLVGTFTGVAQMLENTYMATHSSFFAMISVAEQFANLKSTLGSILGIFALVRYCRALLARITGRPIPGENASSLTPAAFVNYQKSSRFSSSSASSPNHLINETPTPSKKPFLFFFAAIIGLPYLMAKLIKSISLHESSRAHTHTHIPRASADTSSAATTTAAAIANLDFCRVLYSYPPTNAPASYTSHHLDLSVQKGDYVAILSKLDPAGHASDWWQCRTRDHRIGYLPALYLEPLMKPTVTTTDNDPPYTIKPLAQIEHGRVNTITSILGDDESRSAITNGSDPAAGDALQHHYSKSQGDKVPRIISKRS